MADGNNDILLAEKNWNRYEYVRGRGHDKYIVQAKKCEGFYLGGGLQWSDADRQANTDAGKPSLEINTTMPAINIILGYQLSHRADISFKPRGGDSDQDGADRLTKVTKQISDESQLHWKESQVFGDGVIEQRGYFDVRINYDQNMKGNVDIDTLDPLDVLPDPDSNSYDPDDWKDVIVNRWLTLDDIEQLYGKKASDKVAARGDSTEQGDSELDGEERNKFGDEDSGYNDALAEFTDAKSTTRYKIVDRQYWKYVLTEVYVFPGGDIKPIPANHKAEDIVVQVEDHGATVSKQMHKRIRWTVSTKDVVLHDDWSPYLHFTVVPFFAYFRRGQTRGAIDNLIGPQELLNKSFSQYLHIINTTANSGYTVEEGSLVNMTIEDLERDGAKTGLVLEHKENSKPPQKIEPNKIPTGIAMIGEKAQQFIKDVSGMSGSMQGDPDKEVSGRAIDSMKQQGVIQLAVILDNLAHTRRLLAGRILDLVQGFITDERIYMITDESDISGNAHYPLVVNQYTPNGIMNDLTAGIYDFVIDEQPTQVTFNETQFSEAMSLRKSGISIPDRFIIQHSSLNKKNEIIKAMEESGAAPPDPAMEAKVDLILAQVRKVDAEVTRENVHSVFSAMQAAGAIAGTPGVAVLGDEVLKSAGFVDQNGGMAAPEPGALAEMPVAGEVDPAALLSPGIGGEAGIETQRNEGVIQ